MRGIRVLGVDPLGDYRRLVDTLGGTYVELGANSNQRSYGTNAHHDVTWTADATGAVTNRLRYDPWGGAASTSGSSLPDFRFQGSWYDANTDLSWVITRWYAPSLGRFVSEDSLLGEPRNPSSRHLYAYGEGDPIAGWDPDGRARYRVTSTVKVKDLPGIVLHSLTVVLTWRTKRSCCVGIPVVSAWTATGFRTAYEYGLKTGGWYPSKMYPSWPQENGVYRLEGGVDKKYVKVQGRQTFGYAGVFSSWVGGVYVNRIKINITGRADGTYGCSRSVWFQLELPVFDFRVPAQTCRRTILESGY